MHACHRYLCWMQVSAARNGYWPGPAICAGLHRLRLRSSFPSSLTSIQEAFLELAWDAAAAPMDDSLVGHLTWMTPRATCSTFPRYGRIRTRRLQKDFHSQDPLGLPRSLQSRNTTASEQRRLRDAFRLPLKAAQLQLEASSMVPIAAVVCHCEHQYAGCW